MSLELRDAPVQQVLDAVSRGAELPLVVDPDAQVLVGCARMTVLSGKPVSGDELFVLIAEALAPAALNLSRASTGGWIVRRNPGVSPPDSCAAGAAAAPTFDPAPPSDAGLPADASATARIISGIRRISDTELEVTAASRELFLASGASSARFIPVMRDGGAAGVRMFVLRKDGVLAALGLKNGDTLLAVNGQPISP